MEGNVTERRFSVAITPLWLDSSASTAQPASSVVYDNITREVSPRPEGVDDGHPPPNKIQINAADVPRIQVLRHRPGANETNFENTEVEELIAMLRETENLEDQGDILQYLVDTQGLDFNTGTIIQLPSTCWELYNNLIGNFHNHFMIFLLIGKSFFRAI